MSYEFGKNCEVETRRWLWLVGIVFAIMLLVQYAELPYGNVISSVFSDGKAQVPIRVSPSAADVSRDPNNLGNWTVLSSSNSTGAASAHEMDGTEKISDEKNNILSGKDSDFHDLSGLDQEDDPNDDASSENIELNHNSTVRVIERNDSSELVNARDFAENFGFDNTSTASNSSLSSNPEEIMSPKVQENGIPDVSTIAPSYAMPQISPPPLTSPTSVNTNAEAPVNAMKTFNDNEGPEPLQIDVDLSGNITTIPGTPVVKDKPKIPPDTVVSLSQMYDMLLMSRASSFSMKPRWSSAVDQKLLDAKAQIESAPIIGSDHGLQASIYRNISRFRRSYELMEQTLKVYIYKEGNRPVFHQPVVKGIYASEGWFMKLLKTNKHYVTKDPKKAHLFYLPFSSRMLEETLYVPNSHRHKNLIAYLEDYLNLIVAKYPFWNRTGGADHFLAACHDWAPTETRHIMKRCIRALCNSDIKEGFEMGKDMSLPETNIRTPQNPLRNIGGNAPSNRPILAFFAGKMHGYVRPILLQYWDNKDPDIKVFSKLPKSKNNRNYFGYMKNSKYCLCPKGYEVNSPRVVEAIFFECVPVIISDNFVPPFFEILNWESFAVFVQEKDIPNLKNILISISDQRYQVMQQRVKLVQQHFLWHAKPVNYDIFHMILHSIWYNRVFQVRSW